jgi:glutathione S-transferase
MTYPSALGQDYRLQSTGSAMRLLYSPGACSISPHILLEEIGAPFETQRIAITDGETRRVDFLSINPKGKVPVLILSDGTVVTESPVICHLLARLHPESRLLPADLAIEFEVLQLCEYMTGTLHGQGLARLFQPGRFCPADQHSEAVRETGVAIMLQGFELISPLLTAGPFLFDWFTIADASLFYLELHARRFDIRMPEAVDRHYKMMLERVSVRLVLERERVDAV